MDSSAATGSSSQARTWATAPHRPSGLFDVLQIERPKLGECRAGLRQGPSAVRVDAYAAVGTERRPHRGHPRDVVVERLARLGDLDLRRPATVRAEDDRARLVRPDRGDRAVHRHRAAAGVRPGLGGHRIGGIEPGQRGGIVVVPKRVPLGPPSRSAPEDPLAHDHAAETGRHGNREHHGVRGLTGTIDAVLDRGTWRAVGVDHAT